MATNRKIMVYITALFLVCQIIIMLLVVGKGRIDYFHGVIATTTFLLLFSLMEIRFRIYMNNYVRMLVAITILCDGLFGYYFDWYANSMGFDKVLHVFGSYSFSLFLYIIVVQLLDHPVRQAFTFILLLCLGIAAGSVYEVLEFAVDMVSHPVPPSQPSLFDTDLDMIGNMAGAFLAAVHAKMRRFVNADF